MRKISPDKWVRQMIQEGVTFIQVPDEVDITDVHFTPEWRSPGSFVYPDSYYWDATIGFLELITEEEEEDV